MTLAYAPTAQTTTIRNDWSKAEVEALFAMPFNDLLFNAQVVHRQHFNPNEVQVSTLLSIKTGACPEDCKYCPQSARYDTGLEKDACWKLKKLFSAQKKQSKLAQPAFAWARRGETLAIETCLIF